MLTDKMCLNTLIVCPYHSIYLTCKFYDYSYLTTLTFISTLIANFSIVWTALYLMRIACYFHEKHKNFCTVTVHSAMFYVHSFAIYNDLHARALCCLMLDV